MQQCGDLLLRARPQQAAQQHGHAERVVEGDVGGRITVQLRGDLLLRARLPQAVQQAAYGERVVEGNMAAAQRTGRTSPRR